jgi:biotin operon repressor
MKKERELMKLARKKHSAEQIAKKLDASPSQILKVAKRLGVDLGPQPLKLDRRLGARSK